MVDGNNNEQDYSKVLDYKLIWQVLLVAFALDQEASK